MGQTAEEPSTDAAGEPGSRPQISARIGSGKPFDLEPAPTDPDALDTELRGIVRLRWPSVEGRRLCMAPTGTVTANGQPSRLGVPGVV